LLGDGTFLQRGSSPPPPWRPSPSPLFSGKEALPRNEPDAGGLCPALGVRSQSRSEDSSSSGTQVSFAIGPKPGQWGAYPIFGWRSNLLPMRLLSRCATSSPNRRPPRQSPGREWLIPEVVKPWNEAWSEPVPFGRRRPDSDTPPRGSSTRPRGNARNCCRWWRPDSTQEPPWPRHNIFAYEGDRRFDSFSVEQPVALAARTADSLQPLSAASLFLSDRPAGRAALDLPPPSLQAVESRPLRHPRLKATRHAGPRQLSRRVGVQISTLALRSRFTQSHSHVNSHCGSLHRHLPCSHSGR
jgi:hypothetical protein